MRLYIAGPMTGLSEYNYPAFERARERLEARGFDVLCPTDNGADEEPGARSWQWYMRRALRQLLDADGVALLPGWEKSKGATLEHTVARTLTMPAHPVDEWVAAEARAVEKAWKERGE